MELRILSHQPRPTSKQLTHAGIIKDRQINAVFICLPSAMRYEWAYKALESGKHVMLDSPGTGNLRDMVCLYKDYHRFYRTLTQPPIFLKVSPYRFHPSWQLFASKLDRAKIAKVTINILLPTTFAEDKEARFRYEHAGGAGMGVMFAMSLMRDVFECHPTACIRSEIGNVGRP
jgi:hypothetical protein